ncbi:MAG: heme exporter protein CcmB [Planctomycetes bacterium]|nr:heme exporter protein CcmB [Planctomycetota bacterium]
MSGARWFAAAAAVFRRDLLAEVRGRETVAAMLVFSVLVIFVAGAVAHGFGRDPGGFASAAMWVTFLFSGSIGLSRAVMLDRENEVGAAIMLTAAPGPAVYVGKWAAATLFLSGVQIASLPFLGLLLSVDAVFERFPPLAALVALMAATQAAVGTLSASITARTRARELITPLLFFPLLLPILHVAVRATDRLLAAGPPPAFGDVAAYYGVIGAAALVYLLSGALLYRAAVETW